MSDVYAELVEWLRDRPRFILGLARRFPMACTVRAKPGVKIYVPSPGSVGIVCGYGLPTSTMRGGWISVVGHDVRIAGDIKAQCAPDELEVVACGTVTFEMVERAAKELEQ